MKIRLLSVVLILLLAFSGAAFAQDYFPQDNIFAEYSTDSLYLFKSMIDVVLASREDKDKAVTVPIGIYTVGIDIPVGYYTIIDVQDKIVSCFSVHKDGTRTFVQRIGDGAQLGKIALSDGQVVLIENGPVIFTKYKGLGF